MQFYSQLHAYCKTLKNPFHSPIRLSQTLLPNECGYYKHLYIVIHRDHTKKQTHYIYFITKKKTNEKSNKLKLKHFAVVIDVEKRFVG